MKKKLRNGRKVILKTLLAYVENFKNDDPHHISVGLAIGVFVAVTPTIPFHTALALLLTVLIKGSKTAAIIGVWFCNPITVPFFYIGSYKVGAFIFENNTPLNFDKINSIASIFKFGVDVTIMMIVGGIILGIVPSVSTYIVSRYILSLLGKKPTKVTNSDER